MSTGRVPGPRQSLFQPLRSVSGAAAVADSDYFILADATGGAFDVTLPSAVNRAGRSFVVKRVISVANAVTVKSTAGTLDGVAAGTGIGLSAQWMMRKFTSDGANWFITGAFL